MATSKIQFVTNEEGEETAVIESERETSYLLSSSSMRRRLTEALQRSEGLSLDTALEKLGI